MSLPTINSHNSWSRLEETWLGDVYPSSWYEHLEPSVRDVFQRLTEITQEDLRAIEQCLMGFDIIVRRPRYDRIDNYIDQTGQLVKPQICPRDHYCVIGNELLAHATPSAWSWEYLFPQYQRDARSRVLFPQELNWNHINGANTVRAGRDLYIDTEGYELDLTDRFQEYRVHLLNNGGHMDGCFAILRPGLILANHYFTDYEKTFPGWEIIMLSDPTFKAAPSTGYQQPYPVYNGKFWNTSVGTSRSFNEHIVKHALDWVGCYTETYFELNCLVIDESNVVMLAENEPLARRLESYGIHVHWVPFRARSFWDGAMHCLTLDIRRQSRIEDFFPNRG